MISFPVLDRLDQNADGTFDLASNPIYFDPEVGINYFVHYVERGQEMRPDKICQFIWNDASLVAELTFINAIVNPFSIKKGDVIFYCAVNDLKRIQSTKPISDILKTKWVGGKIGQSIVNTVNVASTNVSNGAGIVLKNNTLVLGG